MGRDFPKGKLLFECESTSIPNLLARQQRDVTAKHACGHAMHRDWLAELDFYAQTRQQPPICFDQRTARGQIENERRSSRPKAGAIHP